MGIRGSGRALASVVAGAALVILGVAEAGATDVQVAPSDQVAVVRKPIGPGPGSAKPSHPAPLNKNGDTAQSVNAGGDARTGDAALAPSCTFDYACVWVDANFGGRRGQFAQANSSWGSFPNATCQTGNWKNCASSTLNSKASDTFYMFQDVNFGGYDVNVPPGVSYSYLGSFNDDAESNFF